MEAPGLPSLEQVQTGRVKLQAAIKLANFFDDLLEEAVTIGTDPDEFVMKFRSIVKSDIQQGKFEANCDIFVYACQAAQSILMTYSNVGLAELQLMAIKAKEN